MQARGRRRARFWAVWEWTWRIPLLAVLIPWTLAQLAYYLLRKWITGVPVSCDCGKYGQCEVFKKGPNTWN